SAPTIPTLGFGSSGGGDINYLLPSVVSIHKLTRCAGSLLRIPGHLRPNHFTFCACRLINRLGYVVGLRKSRSVNPAQRVPNLKPCKTDRQPHQVLRTSTSKHSHVPAWLQHPHAFFPH